MSLIVVGEFLGTREREGTKQDGSSWKMRWAVVVVGRDGVNTLDVLLGDRFEGDLPERGEVVAIECSAKVFTPVNKSTGEQGRPRVEYSGWRTVPEVAAALSAGRGSRMAAVAG